MVSTLEGRRVSTKHSGGDAGGSVPIKVGSPVERSGAVVVT